MKNLSAIVRTCTAIAAAALAFGAAAAPVALVTDVVGSAATPTAASPPLRLLSELAAGTEIDVADGGEVVVFYLRDGAEYSLRGPGRYRFAARAPEARNGAAAPVRKPAPPAYGDLRLRGEGVAQGGLTMRSAEILLRPRRNEVLLEPDVAFAWTPLGPGASYRFELVDDAGRRLLAAETAETALRLPAAVQLQPGQLYTWAVRGRDEASGRSYYRSAEFRIVDAATRSKLDAARPGPGASFSERVLYAALLEEFGATTAAVAQREALSAERRVDWAPVR